MQDLGRVAAADRAIINLYLSSVLSAGNASTHGAGRYDDADVK